MWCQRGCRSPERMKNEMLAGRGNGKCWGSFVQSDTDLAVFSPSLSSARVPLPDQKHPSCLFLSRSCKSQGLETFCSGHLGRLFQCILRMMAVSLILCTSLLTFQHKKQEFSCHAVFSKNVLEQTSNQSHLSSSWEQETLQVKWVGRAVVMLGFWERHCLYLVLGMCYPWCMAVMWVLTEQLHRCAWSPLGVGCFWWTHWLWFLLLVRHPERCKAK